MTLTITELLIAIYFILNIFTTGIYVGKYLSNPEEETYNPLSLIAMLLLAGILFFIMAKIDDIRLNLGDLLQIGFLWKFYCTKEFSNMEIKEIETMNSYRDLKAINGKLRAFMWNYCIDLVNKRFKYTPKKEDINT